MPEILQEIGAAAGLAAVLGLAVLSALYFSQARDVKRLREWAGRAPERSETAAPAMPGRVVAQPQTPQSAAKGPPPVPVPRPAAAAAAGAGPATAQQSKPAGVPVPASAAATAAGAAAAATTPGSPVAKPAQEESRPREEGAGTEPDGEGARPNGEGAKPDGEGGQPATPAAAAPPNTGPPASAPPNTGSPAAAPPNTGSPASAPPTTGSPAAAPPNTGSPASAPLRPAEAGAASPPGTRPSTPAGAAGPPPVAPPPIRRGSAPQRPVPRPAASRAAPQETVIIPRGGSQPWYARIGARYVALLLVGLLVLGGGAAYGVTQLTGDDSSDSPGAAQGASATNGAAKPKSKGAAVDPGSVTVAVLNGTSVPGLAATLSDQVSAAGFKVGTITNFSDQQLAESVVQYAPGHQAEAKAVSRRVGITQREPVSPSSRALAGDATVIVIAGSDKAP